MERIVDRNSTGKTRKLLEYAAQNGCTVVCRDPVRMAEKLQKYGIKPVHCISYEDFDVRKANFNYVIDELEAYFTYYTNQYFNGYTLTCDR